MMWSGPESTYYDEPEEEEVSMVSCYDCSGTGVRPIERDCGGTGCGYCAGCILDPEEEYGLRPCDECHGAGVSEWRDTTDYYDLKYGG